jgi:(2R)-sulfolactate sulfo-lyase subunit alpha
VKHSFLIHHDGDDVAVAVRDVDAGEEVVVVAMDTGAESRVTTRAAVPLGHKVALKDLSQGAPLHKYGLPVGTVTAPIATGDHVHTHNVRSARW